MGPWGGRLPALLGRGKARMGAGGRRRPRARRKTRQNAPGIDLRRPRALFSTIFRRFSAYLSSPPGSGGAFGGSATVASYSGDYLLCIHASPGTRPSPHPSLAPTCGRAGARCGRRAVSQGARRRSRDLSGTVRLGGRSAASASLASRSGCVAVWQVAFSKSAFRALALSERNDRDIWWRISR
jgi:hypothetical protein